VLLATASVLAKNRSGVFVPCRALLDSRSQLHLITSRFANQLQVKKIKSSASVTGIGDYAPQRVDLLIGASLFFEMLCVGQIKFPPGSPLIQKTRLGLLVSGGYGLSNDSTLMSSQGVLLAYRENSFDRLDDLLRRFWEVESCAEEGIPRSRTYVISFCR